MFLNQPQCGECGCCVKGSGWLWWAMIVFTGYRVSSNKPWVQEYRVSSNKPSCPQWGSSAANTVWMRSNSSNNPAHSHYAAPHWILILELQTKVSPGYLNMWKTTWRILSGNSFILTKMTSNKIVRFKLKTQGLKLQILSWWTKVQKLSLFWNRFESIVRPTQNLVPVKI